MNVKLLICDDEKIIREGLASMDWNTRGIEVVGTAKNGEVAFELFQKMLPDIVISDIKMPTKDGIWLSEQIHKISPNTKIIFLTGYNDFEYAQSAINNGVCQYLLKPIDEFELYEIVDKLTKEIHLEQQKAEKEIELRKTLRNSRYFLLNYLFNRAQYGILDFELFEISKKTAAMTTFVIRLDTDSTNYGMNFMIFEALIEHLPKTINFIPFFSNSDLVFICCFNEPEGESEQKLFSCCENLGDFIDTEFNVNYNIGIGIFTSEISELEASYTSALQALDYSDRLGQGNIIYINDIEPKSQLSAYQSKLIETYIKALKNNDEKQSKKSVKELFDVMERSDMNLYNQQRRCMSLILSISDALYDIDCDPTILFKNTDAWSLIRKTQSPAELKTFVENITDVIISYIESVQKQKAANIITQVKALVEKNYARDASLETVASQVFISPCYLSVIFKKETNITFKNYLIQTRIEKAKELLEKTDLKIYDIAEKVGYNNTRYFSELFQRICGKTPSQYRASHNPSMPQDI